MKFTHENKTYFLNFHREKKDVTVIRGEAIYKVKSTHPFTTARLYQQEGKDIALLAENTVGCNPIDFFSKETGRLEALRGLGRIIPRDLRKAMWEAYSNRRGY